MQDLFMSMAAQLSDCGLYRYSLSRVWDASLSRVCWVMLNPSTADASQDDPTIRRCMGFARAWGHGGIHVVNLFAFRATNPNQLHDASDPVGPENDWHILAAAKDCHVMAGRVVAAWGVMGTYRDRERHVLRMLRDYGYTVECLGLTKHGRPKHPLYVAAETPLTPMNLEALHA